MHTAFLGAVCHDAPVNTGRGFNTCIVFLVGVRFKFIFYTNYALHHCFINPQLPFLATAIEALEDSDKMSTGRLYGTLDEVNWINSSCIRMMKLVSYLGFQIYMCVQATSTVTYPGQSQISVFIPDDLPKTVARTLNEESTPMSMDFHPVQHTVLLG